MMNYRGNDFEHEAANARERFWRGVRETIALTIAIMVILWIG